jgi:photosystem II stability/assembly factor-like uncharacterized protein
MPVRVPFEEHLPTTRSKEPLMRWTIAAILTAAIALTGSTGAGAAPRSSAPIPIKLTSLHMIDATTGWGQNGHSLFRTTNGGRLWTDVTPSGARHAGVDEAYFLSGNTAWLAATSGSDYYNGRVVVYRTINGGAHWMAATTSATGMGVPSFANRRDGWLFVTKGPGAGQNPYILLRSTDGGAHWQVVAQNDATRQTHGSFPGCDCTFAITFRNGLTGWSTGTQFALQLRDWIWISSDGGRTWHNQSLPIPKGMTVINTFPPVFSGPNNGAFLAELVQGSQTGIYRLYVTHNGGRSWTGSDLLSTLEGGALTTSVVDPWHAWVSDGRNLYRTANAGQHWTPIYPKVPSFARAFWTNGRITDSSPDTTIDFVSATTGFAYDSQSNKTRRCILTTTDGGNSWQPIYPTSR